MPPSSRRERIAALATAVVVVALVVIVILRGNGADDGSAAGPTSGALGSPACGSGDLVVAGRTTADAAGTSYVTATLRLAPDVAPCTVENYPDVVVLEDGSPVDEVAAVDDDALGEPQELVVLPDRPVLVTLGWAFTRYCEEIDNDAILLDVAPGLELEIPGFGATSCDATGDERPDLRVGPYTYVDPRSTNGVVTGVVGLNGGPGPGTGEFVTRGQIEFDSASNDYRTTIGLDGKYEIDLPAGAYQVRVSTLQYRAGEPFARGTFVVVGGELNVLNVILPVR